MKEKRLNKEVVTKIYIPFNDNLYIVNPVSKDYRIKQVMSLYN